jgi:hypothetical protein
MLYAVRCEGIFFLVGPVRHSFAGVCKVSWIKRVETRPVRCPKCKQPNWDIAAGELPMGRPAKARGRNKGSKE